MLLGRIICLFLGHRWRTHWEWFWGESRERVSCGRCDKHRHWTGRVDPLEMQWSTEEICLNRPVETGESA